MLTHEKQSNIKKFCDAIVIFPIMANLEQLGSRIPNSAYFAKLTFSLKVIFYLTKTENRT